MKTRVITAIVALIVFVPILIIGSWPLTFAMSVLGIVAISEFSYMKKRFLTSPETITASLLVIFLILPTEFVADSMGFIQPSILIYGAGLVFLLITVLTKNKFSFDGAGTMLLGSIYIGYGFHYFVQVRQDNWMLLVYGLMIVWLTDSFAYIVGRKFGKHKLIPKISPNKTWEGSVGGSLIAVVIASSYLIIFRNQITDLNYFWIILYTIILSVVGQIGDLIESAYKRYFGFKDSGKILPGHGGILDRFDSMLVVFPLLAFFFEVLP